MASCYPSPSQHLPPLPSSYTSVSPSVPSHLHFPSPLVTPHLSLPTPSEVPPLPQLPLISVPQSLLPLLSHHPLSPSTMPPREPGSSHTYSGDLPITAFLMVWANSFPFSSAETWVGVFRRNSLGSRRKTNPNKAAHHLETAWVTEAELSALTTLGLGYRDPLLRHGGSVCPFPSGVRSSPPIPGELDPKAFPGRHPHLH